MKNMLSEAAMAETPLSAKPPNAKEAIWKVEIDVPQDLESSLEPVL
jgi:hypothetical protein